MSPFLVGMLVAVAVLMAVGLGRVYEGPTVFDRLVAISLVSVNGVVVIVLLGFVFERPGVFLDIALGYALLAFLLPIVLGRFIEVTVDERRSSGPDGDPDGEVGP